MIDSKRQPIASRRGKQVIVEQSNDKMTIVNRRPSRYRRRQSRITNGLLTSA